MFDLQLLIILVVAIIVAIIAWILSQQQIYMKIDPPPDADKPNPNDPADQSCWQATAANMLAGAGYGNGATVQARADDIYGQMKAHFGTVSGWTDTALIWWLTSVNNAWPANPYVVVTVYGYKIPRYPWDEPNGPRFIGNELRRCQMVGLSISWPTWGASIGSGGHAITCWGDNGGSGTLTSNPSRVRVTDSDRDTGGDVQSYAYDAYTNPNPGGPNEGDGWYINYDNNHPYIKHIVTLCPTKVQPGQTPVKVVGSYKIHQDQQLPAVDLHYRVGTDADILSYETTIDWETANPPTIAEDGPPCRELTVDWNLGDKPVPFCTEVTITTKFVLPAWNAIRYEDVHFTYPEPHEPDIPDIDIEVDSPLVDLASTIPNVTGGYVVGSFDIIKPELPDEKRVVSRFRFIHEYSFQQNPEKHTLRLSGDRGYAVSNVRLGHSYGYPTLGRLWEFEDWMTEITDRTYELGEEPVEIGIDWDGRLPYPEGEDIRGRIPEKKRPPEKTE